MENESHDSQRRIALESHDSIVHWHFLSTLPLVLDLIHDDFTIHIAAGELQETFVQ